MTSAPSPAREETARALRGFRVLCVAAFLVIFGLIVLGGVVRATDSGLGCPDWPTCHGSLVPKLEKHTLIEYSHRLTASVAGLLVLALAVWAWRGFRRVPALLLPALAALALIIVQAGLGGAAVLNDLPPEIVAVHLGMALTILALVGLLWTTAGAIESAPGVVRPTAELAGVALASLGAVPVLMLVGSYVAGAGYGLACSGWPLCNGDLLPDLGSASVAVVFLHRLLALFAGALLLSLLWLARSQRELRLLAAAALAVFAGQSLVGAANVWTELADAVAALHLALATLLFVLVAAINGRLQRVHSLLPRSWSPRTASHLAGAAR
jgi:heme A synthase